MDTDLPDELFRIFKTQEAGKKSRPICGFALRQIDQPVAVFRSGDIYIGGGK